MSKKLRKWKMWAGVKRADPENWAPSLSFYKSHLVSDAFWQIIRVEVREVPHAKQK